MSASKLDRSGIFQPLTVQTPGRSLALSAANLRVRRNGIEFQCETPLSPWTEMNIELRAPSGDAMVQGTGVVVACHGSRHTGFTVSMVFMKLSPQSQEQLARMSLIRSL